MTISIKTALSGAALLLATLLTPAHADTAPSATQARIEQMLKTGKPLRN